MGPPQKLKDQTSLTLSINSITADRSSNQKFFLEIVSVHCVIDYKVQMQAGRIKV